MIRSMTAFGRAESEGIAWEIRSVNQRYLDITFKLPEAIRAIEPELRERTKGRLHRGKVDCLLRLEGTDPRSVGLNVDDEMVLALHKAIDHISTLTGSSSSTSPIEMLRWPGVLQDQQTFDDDVSDKILGLFDDALDSLTGMRAREGQELNEFVSARLEELGSIVTSIREEVPAINKRLEERLRERLKAIESEVDKGRLEQELIYMAQKADVQEELDRLDTHIEEVRNSLAQSGTVGRRLDFLMQELNREANTISSKAVAANTSLQTVELKVLIEQMREQIQNIE